MSTALAEVQPLTPMLNARRQVDEGVPEKLDDYLAYLCKEWDKVQWQANKIARFYTWCLAELFWRGQQLVWFNPDSWQFEQMPDDKLDDIYFINNIMLPFVEWIAASYASSNPKLIAYSTSSDDQHREGALEDAQHWIDCQQQRLWSKEDLQRECHLIQFRSLVFTRTYHDPQRGPWIPERMMNSGGKQRAGAIVSEAIDPLQVTIVDRARNIATSPILFFDEIAWNCDMQDMYGIGKIPKGKSEPYAQMIDGLAFKRQLEMALGNSGAPDAMSAYGGNSLASGDPYNITDNLTCRHSQKYFDLRVYRNYIVKAGTEIDDPTSPDKRYRLGSPTKLGEMYDRGLLLCRVNGVNQRMTTVDKNDEWGYCRYTVPATGFYGPGSENMVAQQDWFNEFGSIITSSAVYASNGITAADTSKIKNGNDINQPGVVLAMDDIQPGEDIRNSIVHYNTNGMDAALLQLPNFLKESMQFTSGANNAGGVSGTPNGSAGSDTATAVMNLKAVTDAFSGMRLQLRAENLACRLEQGLKLYQQHGAYPQYITRFGETQGRWLKGMDIPGDIGVRAEEDSHEPRTSMDIRQDTGMAIQMGWGNPQTPPAVNSHLAKTFKLPDPSSGDVWKTKGQKRIDAMMAASQKTSEMAGQMVQGRVAPEVGQQFVAGEVQNAAMKALAPQPLDNHAALIEFYKNDIAVSDWFDNLDDSLKQVIVMVVQLHETGGVMEAQKQTSQMVAAQAPAMQAQQQQEMQSQAAQAQAKGQGDAESQAAQSEADEAARGHEATMAGVQAGEADIAREHEAGQSERQSSEARAQREHDAKENEKARAHERQTMAHDERMAKIQARKGEKK